MRLGATPLSPHHLSCFRDLARLYSEAGRRQVTDCLVEELTAAAAEGPRATDAFAAVGAAAVTSLAATVASSAVLAAFLGAVGTRLDAALTAADALAGRNLTLVVAQLFLQGALRADMLYSLLDSWCQRYVPLLSLEEECRQEMFH